HAGNRVPGRRVTRRHCVKTSTDLASYRIAPRTPGVAHGGAAHHPEQLHRFPNISRHRFATAVRWKRGSGAAAGLLPERHARMRSIYTSNKPSLSAIRAGPPRQPGEKLLTARS